MLIYLKCRAKSAGLPFNLYFGDLKIPKRCPVFKFEFVNGNLKQGLNGGNPRSISVDRIAPEKGYVKGNVVVVSMKANDIKETSSVVQLEKRLKQLRKSAYDLAKVVRFYRRLTH